MNYFETPDSDTILGYRRFPFIYALIVYYRNGESKILKNVPPKMMCELYDSLWPDLYIESRIMPVCSVSQ